MHDGGIPERKQDAADRGNQHVEVAASQVGAPDGAGKQRVADEQVFRGLTFLSNRQADAAGAMTWRVVDGRLKFAERDDVPRRVEHIDRRLRLDADAEHPAVLDDVLVEEEIVAVQIHRHAQRALCGGDAGNVIDVCVREQDVADRERRARREIEEELHAVAGIDDHGLVRLVAPDDEAVLLEGTGGFDVDYHAPMILAVLDDLMFTSKIKATAGQLGVAVTFARSAAAALDEMRKGSPSLVILDLNNARTDPLGIVAAMKQEPELASIATVGYVSHVQTDVINAARQAGVGEVMARSAFTQQLPEILKR